MTKAVSNQEYLSKIIELYHYVHQFDRVFILDLDYQVLFAGNGLSEFISQPLDEILNQNCFKVLPIPPENVLPIKNSLSKVLTTRQTQEFLSVNLNHNENTLILQCIERPLINPSNSIVVGYSIESRKLDYPLYYARILASSLPVSANKLESSEKFLTRREHEIAFLLFHYSNSEKIAEVISKFSEKKVTSKTIRNIISQQLYPKFCVYNSEALLTKLHELSYHKKIPPSLLVNQHLDLSLI